MNILLRENILLKPAIYISKRFKSGPLKQSQGRPHFEKYYGLKVPMGYTVFERDIVCVQKKTELKYHPGLNCALDPFDYFIYSLVEGTLVVTAEKFDPNHENDVVKKFYPNIQGTKILRYVHVIPKKPPNEFQLVNLI